MLQVREGIQDNSKVIFLISQGNTCFNNLKIISINLSYLEHRLPFLWESTL